MAYFHNTFCSIIFLQSRRKQTAIGNNGPLVSYNSDVAFNSDGAGSDNGFVARASTADTNCESTVSTSYRGVDISDDHVASTMAAPNLFVADKATSEPSIKGCAPDNVGDVTISADDALRSNSTMIKDDSVVNIANGDAASNDDCVARTDSLVINKNSAVSIANSSVSINLAGNLHFLFYYSLQKREHSLSTLFRFKLLRVLTCGEILKGIWKYIARYEYT